MSELKVAPQTNEPPPPDDPVKHFSRLWREGQRPELQPFLSQAGHLSHSVVADIVRIDQCQRWRAGERIPAENYLRDYLKGTSNAEAVVDLIYQEFLLREELGEAPSCDEYQRRFPLLAGQ